ncbi:hypothetical protein [Pelagibacterium montanilacus]|uniref:hypothetical protein n=1 Tax=Pelagibacterium montanilacus TaxID=2185280 RepID=UPI000F8CB545|nr:hypothetical protein [Pelagibacterium montanilacus]
MSDGVDWAAVRRAYEDTPEPTRAIAERYGITLDALAKARRAGQWMPRRAGRQTASRVQLIARLMRLLDRQVSQIEEKMGADGDGTLPDVRLLETLTRTMDRLIALDEAERARRPRRLSGPEAEELRTRLADRIMRFGQTNG